MSTPILRTKLFAPDPPAVGVRRERLFALLDRALQSRFTAVVAPAGSGKTTLVGQWLADRGLDAAWFGLDPRDSEPVRFWSYVVEALSGLDGVSLPGTRTTLEAASPEVERVVEVLLNELAASGRAAPAVLVLDDLHALGAPLSLTTLARFLEQCPPVLRVVATSRSDPALPLSRLRARDQLTELRQRDLRFSVEEMARYFEGALGTPVAEDALAILETRTEGWAVSLQLAALSMGRLDPDQHGDFVRGFAGDDRFVVDYLVDEVLARQAPEVQRFLLATSALDRFSGPLCERLFERVAPGARAPSLPDLERAGLFLIPLDRRREWYRYHHLFGDLLRVRCRQELDAPGLLVEASRWFEEERLFEEAMEYAFRAGDPERAAVLESHFGRLIGRGEFGTIREGVKRLPVERVQASTGLCMAMAYVEHISTNLDAAEGWMRRGDELLATKNPSEDRLEQQRAHYSLLRGFRAEARQEVERARELYETARVLFEARSSPSMVGVAEQGLTGVLLAEERFDEAEAMGRRAWRRGMDTGNLLVSSTALNRVVTGMLAQGRLTEAEAFCQEHLGEIGRRQAEEQILVVGYARLGLASVLLARNRLDEAETELGRVEERSRQMQSHSLIARALLDRVRLALVRGDLDGAATLSGELWTLFDEDKVLILVKRMHEALRVRLALARGRLTDAAEWEATVGGEGPFPTLVEMTRARIALARGDAREALRRLEVVEAAAERVGALAWRVEAIALGALALSRLRDSAAVARVGEAVALAAGPGLIRPFLDEGEELGGLLARAMARKGEGRLRGPGVRDFLAHLTSLSADRVGDADDTGNSLSERELDVLRLMAEGLSNKDIAARLFVTVGTVKRHGHNLYRKLGAARRTEAIARARQRGLI